MFLNNHGGGFADHVEVEEGTSIGQFFGSHFPNSRPGDYLIRVNRMPALAGQVLQDNDRVSVTPTLTVRQSVTPVRVGFDDDAVADHFDRCLGLGIPPSRCGRIWWHTHPGSSPSPSLLDQQTFARVFGSCDWAVIFILSRTQRTYARLSFAAGPGGQMPLEVAVDWAAWPGLVRQDEGGWPESLRTWADEYITNVHPLPIPQPTADISVGVEDLLNPQQGTFPILEVAS